MFGCQENTRKEEKEDQVDQSHQGADHLLAETSKCLYAISRKTSCFLVHVSLCYSLMKTFGELPESSLKQRILQNYMQCHECLLLSSSQCFVS